MKKKRYVYGFWSASPIIFILVIFGILLIGGMFAMLFVGIDQLIHPCDYVQFNTSAVWEKCSPIWNKE